MIATIWFCLVAIMIAGYVVLDGFDLGAGIVHLFVAQTDRERRIVLRSIGPVWDGNEVWLLAGGGTLYFAFPALYSAAFSGFYLALMMVLWLLILRGISIEFRSHVESPLWGPFWDLVFGGSSAVLALLFGAALGNVVRGVPLDSDGFFFLPLWTDFQPGTNAGIVGRHRGLVHSFGRRDVIRRSDPPRVLLGCGENRRRFAEAGKITRLENVVGGSDVYRAHHPGEFLPAATHLAAVFSAPLGICISIARLDWTRRHPF
jgi:hypothetical protein